MSRPTDTPVVAFQGALGAFSHEAVMRYWEGRAEALPCVGFAAAIDALVRGAASFAMLPVDNNTIGPIHQAREAIVSVRGIRVVGHVNHPIRHALMALPGATIEAMTAVLSHPAALAQCTRFFAEHPYLEPVVASDTAAAAALVASRSDTTLAAIAPRGAAERYGLELIAEAIQDRDDNVTTFAVLERTHSLSP